MTACPCSPLARRISSILLLALALALSSQGATLYVWPQSPSPTSPYATWSSAAHDIQSAIDAASRGDTVIATNGIYDTGATVVLGQLRNRVAVTNAITLTSVNGPHVTAIRGQGPIGDNAIRCAFVGSNSVVRGFTFTNGASRDVGLSADGSGAGAWCDPSGLIEDCIFASNETPTGGGRGGGLYGGNAFNCLFVGNRAREGGGTYYSCLTNCTLIDNYAYLYGGGALSGNLTSCTVTGNRADFYGGGVVSVYYVSNSIVYYNDAPFGANWSHSVLDYSCSTPEAPGSYSMITNEPGLASMTCLTTNSPCVGAGSPTGGPLLDRDGEPRRSPSAMGSDEPYASVSGPIAVAIEVTYAQLATGFSAPFVAHIDGKVATSAWNFGDGTHITNRPFVRHAWTTSGTYPVVLTAWNQDYPGGVSATASVVVVDQPVAYVNAASTNPVPPFSSWETAAVTIQEGIAASHWAGRLVLVTNGIYSTGGVAVHEALTNRVALTNAVTVRSVNGPELTVIAGSQPPSGPIVRAALVGSDSHLVGFTLTNGATVGGYGLDKHGGGLLCLYGGQASNCLISGNQNGGAEGGTLTDCLLSDNNNTIGWGGGASRATLRRCVIRNNRASVGGGASDSVLENCLVVGNTASSFGGAVVSGYLLQNCTVMDNNTPGSEPDASASIVINSIVDNLSAEIVDNSCISPPHRRHGSGNIALPALFRDAPGGDYRLMSNSPCIDSGTNYPGVDSTPDLAGNPRLLDGDSDNIPQVDMGAYEYNDFPPATSTTSSSSSSSSSSTSSSTSSSSSTTTTTSSTTTTTTSSTTTLPALGLGLDAPALPWTTGGAQPWFTQTATAHDGIDAARSGAIGPTQESWLEARVNGPGLMDFWWKISAAPGDTLDLLVNGTQTLHAIRGETDWTPIAYSVGRGAHTYRWRFAKDASGSVGADAAFLDEVAWTPADRSQTNAVWDRGAVAWSNGWSHLNWFGYYSDPDLVPGGWIWHEFHGSLYISPESSPQSIWWWTSDSSWIWMSPSSYPYLFVSRFGLWVWYLDGSSDPRWFLNTRNNDWYAR